MSSGPTLPRDWIGYADPGDVMTVIASIEIKEFYGARHVNVIVNGMLAWAWGPTLLESSCALHPASEGPT